MRRHRTRRRTDRRVWAKTVDRTKAVNLSSSGQRGGVRL